jgi:hypothetical protein
MVCSGCGTETVEADPATPRLAAKADPNPTPFRSGTFRADFDSSSTSDTWPAQVHSESQPERMARHNQHFQSKEEPAVEDR